MPGTVARPNANMVLSLMRDDDIGHDPFGTAMSWAGAVCDVLYDADPNMVPADLGYSPGMGGPEVPRASDVEVYRITLADVSWPTGVVWCWLHGVSEDDPSIDPDALPYWSDPTFAARAEDLRTALVCLHRYIGWCEAAGRSY